MADSSSRSRSPHASASRPHKEAVVFNGKALAAAAACTLALIVHLTAGQQQQTSQPMAPVPAVLQHYAPVTLERLKKPEDASWLTVRRTYDGWGYSPLGLITPQNVSRLQPVWVLSTGVANGHEASP